MVLQRKEKSDHYDGKRFHNIPPDRGRLLKFFKWFFNRHPKPWPAERKVEKRIIPETRLAKQKFRATYINHSTVLIQWEGLNLLTDPIWSMRCSPVSWFGPKRIHEPGVAFADLPPIDLILLSHNHYDHLDITTLRKLYQRHHPLIITGIGVGAYLAKHKIQSIEMDWWENCNLFKGIEATFVPARHFSSRHILDYNRTLWGGFFLRGPSGAIYFAGDTGYGDHFIQIKDRLGSPDLAMLPIGTYEPRWFMQASHLSPHDAVRAHIELSAQQSIGIHFGTFHLSDEGIDDPPLFLMNELNAQQINLNSFLALKPGQSIDLH